ncbi:mannose-binding protein a [Plakobranchus ocellatus]|uniref:Mannose-binding protein a n=1 Tax=Plakobranchus ocellatus TaxID=259542 RepID=A0AAV3ZA59_9GAST|nr:mannose-binding protein a [Plakobranchus ocellatus]
MEYQSVTSMTLERRAVGSTGNYTEIGTITADGKVNKLGSEIASLRGGVKLSQPKIFLKYVSPDAGYCYFYKCTVRGINSAGEEASRSGRAFVMNRLRTPCTTPTTTKAPSCAAPEAIAKLEEKVEHCSAQLAGLNKLYSININEYTVSSLFKGRVYTISKKNERFGLQKMNDRCKEIGGYLVEVDNQEEQAFVANFSKFIGNRLAYIGANDIQKEGTFVHYNSEKVMSDVKWVKGEPNNYGSGEDCLVIKTNGLNDISCSRTSRYICEIPII